MVIELINKSGVKFDLLFDEADYDIVKQYKWFSQKIGHNTYAVSDQRGQNRKGQYIYLHRLIMNVTDTNVMVDHINRNGLDNRRENLRLANKSVNMLNSRFVYKNKAGYKGVERLKSGKYRARMGYMGESLHF